MAGRIYSIDAMRIIAMVFVVVIHTDPFAGLGTYGNAANFVLETTARFAVPFFFVTSGYFFALKTARGDPTGYFVKRVTAISSLYAFGILLAFPVFLVGTAISAGVENRAIASAVVGRTIEFASPVELFYYGTSVSEILWFLPALLYSSTFIYLFVRLDATDWLLPVSLGLHIVGLAGASYTMFVDVPFQIRDALFFGFFYTALGYHVGSRNWRPARERSLHYLGATVLFGLLHVWERYALGYALTGETFARDVYSPSYTIGTALVTTSLFFFLLSRPRLGEFTPLPAWGRRYAVGIYVAHPAVLFALQKSGEALGTRGYDLDATIAWHLALTPATFFGALLLYVAAHELRIIEIGGSHLPRLGRIRRRESAK